jgi:hypothetical protein
VRTMASKVTRFDPTWIFPVRSWTNHAHLMSYGRTSGAFFL